MCSFKHRILKIKKTVFLNLPGMDSTNITLVPCSILDSTVYNL